MCLCAHVKLCMHANEFFSVYGYIIYVCMCVYVCVFIDVRIFVCASMCAHAHRGNLTEVFALAKVNWTKGQKHNFQIERSCGKLFRKKNLLELNTRIRCCVWKTIIEILLNISLFCLSLPKGCMKKWVCRSVNLFFISICLSICLSLILLISADLYI